MSLQQAASKAFHLAFEEGKVCKMYRENNVWYVTIVPVESGK
jgi:hypothetical protein